MKSIGVIGGMGPESTAIYYQALIKQCQDIYGAKYDKDFPEIIIYNLPIPDVVERLEDQRQTINALITCANKLLSAGAEFLAMPCNTVHYFYPQVTEAINAPFICIFLAAAKKIKSIGLKKVGFLSTTTTKEMKSFADDFSRNNIELIFPESSDQDKVNHIILNILQGSKSNEDKAVLIDIIYKLKKQGAEGVVLACTDLPLLINQQDVDIQLFDTVDILAEATINYALGRIGDEILE